jgi:pimeloyl-ACP methyl ester carboxylesterase
LDQTAQALRVIEQSRAKRVHLVAHDYAVGVGQELLARAAERTLPFELASVCFLNGALFPEVYRPRPIQKLLLSPLGALATRIVARRVFTRAFSAVFGAGTRPSQDELGHFWSLLSGNDGMAVQHHMCRMTNDRIRHRARWGAALEKTQVPLRFINGSVDPNSGEHMAKEYARRVPRPDVVHLPGIGHYPHFEAPEATAKAILEVIDRSEGLPVASGNAAS